MSPFLTLNKVSGAATPSPSAHKNYSTIATLRAHRAPRCHGGKQTTWCDDVSFRGGKNTQHTHTDTHKCTQAQFPLLQVLW